MKARLAAVPDERMHLVLMMVLTFSTGIIDAVGYLGLDRVFTANMTGNVVILGMGLVGAEDLPVLGPLLALGGFMAGAALGGRVLRRAPGPWSALTTGLFLSVGVVCVALAVVLLVVGATPSASIALPVTTVLGLAMGVQAATARFVAVPDVTTVMPPAHPAVPSNQLAGRVPAVSDSKPSTVPNTVDARPSLPANPMVIIATSAGNIHV